jgi:hypothetical protein
VKHRKPDAHKELDTMTSNSYNQTSQQYCIMRPYGFTCSYWNPNTSKWQHYASTDIGYPSREAAEQALTAIPKSHIPHIVGKL